MNNELPLPEDTTKKIYFKALTGVSLGLVFAAAFFVAGIRYEKTHVPKRLPANQACLAYADAISKALEAAQNQIVAVVKEEELPKIDFDGIKKQFKDCHSTSDIYKVTMEGSK